MVKLLLLGILIILLILIFYPHVVCLDIPDGYELVSIHETRKSQKYLDKHYARKEKMLLRKLANGATIVKDVSWRFLSC